MAGWRQHSEPREDVNYREGVGRVSGNASLYIELLHMFFEEEGVKQISRALSEGDSLLARQRAHRFKGTAANLGLAGLEKLAAAIEKSVSEDPGQAQNLARQLQEDCSALYSVVRTLRQNREGA